MIQSVQRAAQILAVLGSGTPRLGVTEIADRTGLAKPTVHGLLRTLEAHELVAQDPDTGKKVVVAGTYDVTVELGDGRLTTATDAFHVTQGIWPTGYTIDMIGDQDFFRVQLVDVGGTGNEVAFHHQHAVDRFVNAGGAVLLRTSTVTPLNLDLAVLGRRVCEQEWDILLTLGHAAPAPYGLPVPDSPLYKIGLHQSGPAADPDDQDDEHDHPGQHASDPRLQPVGRAVGNALLEEVRALRAVGKPLQQDRAIEHLTHHGVADRQVVVDEIELGLASLREERLRRIRHLSDR